MRAYTQLWRHRCRRSKCGRERVHMIRIFSSVNTLNHRHTTKYIIMEPAPRCCEADWSRGWQAAIMITLVLSSAYSHQCNLVIMFETNVWQIVGSDAVKSTTAANEMRNQCRRLHAVTVDVFFSHQVYHQFPYENVVFSSICWDYKWHLTRSAEKIVPSRRVKGQGGGDIPKISKQTTTAIIFDTSQTMGNGPTIVNNHSFYHPDYCLNNRISGFIWLN